MKYNITQYSQTISNTTEGDIDLSTNEIISIINSSAIANVPMPVSGTLSGTLVLDCDLGARVHLDEVQYHFSSSDSMPTVASGIKFYYKNEDFEVYTSLDTYYNNNYYYTIVSGTSAPRFIRLEHTTFSGGVSGHINGFYALNDDTYVDFGEDGNDTSTNFMLSVENIIIETNELEVFNSGPVKASAKLIIEPQNTVADDILSISDSPDGPWYGVYRDEDKVTGTSLWETGNMFDLQISSDVLKLLSGKTFGTYTTRVVYLDEDQRLTFNIMDFSYPAVSPIIEFADNFTYGNDYGYWTVEDNYSYFRNARLEMETDNAVTYTTNILEHTDDWVFQCKFYITRGGFTGSNLRIYANNTSGAYVYWQINTSEQSTSYIKFITSTGTKYERVTDDITTEYAQKWVWVKVQKNFNTLRFKHWVTSDPEPDWIGSYTLALSEVADTGRIYFKLIDSWSNYLVYIDDVSLTKNATATPSNDSFISVDPEDTTETIEVRSSNSRPMNRESFIRMTGSYGSSTKYTNHYWIEDSSLDTTSSDWGTWGRTSNFWEYWYDSIRDDEYIIDKPFYTAGNTEVTFRIRRKSGTLYSTTITNTGYTSDCFYSTYKLSPDNTGGFWINFFLGRGDINNGIYYLRYYDSTMGLLYNRQTDSGQGTFLYDMDTVYNSNGHLWYTDRDLSTVFKLNTDGTILASYLATENIRGILALSDGGCWFIQEQALIRLDSNGQVIDIIQLSGITASYIYSDLNGGFWLHEGVIVHHLRSDGTEYFSITIPNLFHITVINSGFITKEHDGSTTTPPQASYISSDHQRVIRTWNYPQNEGGYEGTFDTNRYGARSHTYDDLVDDHASHFPISADSNWDSSVWKSVSLRDYNFTNEQYHQIRFNLRADNSANSPEVYGLWTQRAIEVPDIYPYNYGKFYLKSDVTYLAPQDAGDYTSKVKAYWLLNEE